MVNERVSLIKVGSVDPHIARLFAGAGLGKIVPQPGVVVYRIGSDRFAVNRMLEGGGKVIMILEIVDGVLRSTTN